ncbi:MAG TPA: type II secretion system F family protein [Anaerovoracaceae bacterium]|nr:type II secretion system F family protein [Anaerovoracaceae bacterium]
MKQFSFLDFFYKTAEKAALVLPDWITGKSEVMDQKYHIKYGARDYSGLIRQNKTRTMVFYLATAAAFLIVSAGTWLANLNEQKEITEIKRPAFGDPAESIPVEARMKYKEYELARDVTLKVKPKKLTEPEKQALLLDYKTRLEGLILGENRDPEHISKPLNLVERDMATGITVSWSSDHPKLISETGEIDLIGAKNGQTVELLADLSLDEASDSRVIRLKLDTEAAEEDYVRSMAGRLEESVTRLVKAEDFADVSLPGELGEGVEVRWSTDKDNNGVFITAAFLIVVVIAYLKRYDQINKEIKETEESIIKDLPEFINKLVLLLNAGLVVSTAFSKIAGDYEAYYHGGKTGKLRKKRYLYEELLEMEKRVDRSNASLIKELKEFSRRCGVREMVRLTAVISDNWNKGSALAEKLEGEGELLWIGRKKRAEEKGRLAETKLTFPLMILLMVLIMVTIAPAMLEM